MLRFRRFHESANRIVNGEDLLQIGFRWSEGGGVGGTHDDAIANGEFDLFC
jgi:hypothetical protein